MSTRNVAGTLTKRQFAETFGLSEKQIERYCQQGMPHTKDGRVIRLQMPQAREWYKDYLVDKGRKQNAPTSMDEAKKRREIAQAELAELDLAERRRELMRVDDYARNLSDAFSRVRARLQNFAPRAAGLVVGASTIQEAQARLDPLVREVMDELRAADDVPEPDQEEAA